MTELFYSQISIGELASDLLEEPITQLYVSEEAPNDVSCLTIKLVHGYSLAKGLPQKVDMVTSETIHVDLSSANVQGIVDMAPDR
ncbi:hypothetical protein D8674_010496 [Pyrus ussuriensis x Pyrus communis]|uniref:Uncharacterized protein n=1 Tax=Pyrus ussuriensis x Pyrus communis TaxID=2448454 RepID=A0A5N5FAX3_9ROSA|nr:hypothetical protein D8674_010496 [Pyrus ussuriensis x Pyrus communis]